MAPETIHVASFERRQKTTQGTTETQGLLFDRLNVVESVLRRFNKSCDVLTKDSVHLANKRSSDLRGAFGYADTVLLSAKG